ncbi:MAG TPA: cytochrome c [Draconibacterium sp.]|nr:cytochrome c [Draconibacterium sp.]
MSKLIYFFILVFIILSCNVKNKKDQTTIVKDSIQADSSKAMNQTENIKMEDEIKLTYAQQQGKYIYLHYCSICHGVDGKGDGFNSYNLNPRPRDFTDVKYMNALSDEYLVETITQGGAGVNKSHLMPSWGNTLKTDDIQRVVAYVRLFSTKNTN